MTKQWRDPDDAPELTEEFFAHAEIRDGDTVLRPASGALSRGPGRPKSENPKRQVTLRLDGDLIDRMRATGPGWQVRAGDALAEAFKAKP